MKLANFFIKKKIRDAAKETTMRTARFCSLSDASDILVVFNVTDQNDVLICMENMHELAKNIHLCAYVPKKNKEQAVHTSWLYIFEDELDSKGVPTDVMVDKFKTLPADILIDLTRKNNYAMQYLQLKHPSLFKVGTKSFLRDLYDLTIPMADDVDINKYFGHVVYYLQTIRSK
jgi:hypothetical protein